ncbi:uncharacterized protein RSE6_02468 [Rhynchosporium secalis]|uniref:Mid2 domain-containing protein n=1 Tax=Rhynchosporium secalis TaxID=38038 RepID=A0A1E1M0A7_RHYSE|nr:uncharacterized protein RSE6_02468 [Rhynchosporium secalis]
MSNSSACWLPDGQTRSPTGRRAPCDPSELNSACCAAGEACMGNGLCLSQNGLIYRRACTDRDWKDPACSTFCIEASGRHTGQQTDFEFLKPCNAGTPGSAPTGILVWICGLNNNCSDPSTTFPLIVGSSDPSSIQSSNQTPAQTLALASSSSNPNLTSKDECSSSKTTIGAGIGVPLGVLLVMALLWAFWERRRRSTAKQTNEKTWVGNVMEYEPAPAEAPAAERITEPPPKAYQHTHRELA